MTPTTDLCEKLEELAKWHKAYAWKIDADATTLYDKNANSVFVSHHSAAIDLRQAISLLRREGTEDQIAGTPICVI